MPAPAASQITWAGPRARIAASPATAANAPAARITGAHAASPGARVPSDGGETAKNNAMPPATAPAPSQSPRVRR